jgi:hypothetical protein
MLGATLVFAMGCSDDSGNSPADGGVDGKITLPEAGTDSIGGGDKGPACNLTVVGKNCANDSECGVGARCLGTYRDDPNDPATQGGICTCECTPDDPETLLINEDSCGTATDEYICGELELTGGQTQGFCLKRCVPELGKNNCDKRIACDPRAGASARIFNGTVCLSPGCQTDEDCETTTAERCKTDESVKCQQAGARCLAITSGSTDGICVVDGVCDTASGLCQERSAKADTFKAGAKVGDPCLGDTECDANQTCLFEFTQAGERTSFRNGYCTVPTCAFASTIPGQACPAGSHCNVLFSGGLCQKSCDMTDPTGCRGNKDDKFGDYECRNYSTLVNPDTQQPITAGPVCDWGTDMDCNTAATIAGGQFGSNPCSLFGNGQANDTNMRCRHIDTGVDLNTAGTPPRYPDEGHCLDDTDSTGTKPVGDGGTPDGAPADGGADATTPDGGADATTPDAGVDSTTPTPDAGVDSTTPTPDAGVDSTTPTPDAGVDSTTPTPDAGVDSTTPTPDAGVDSATPTPDAGSDMQQPTPDAGTD